MQVFQRGIDRREVLLHDGFAALAVGLLDRVLDLLDRFVLGQHAADGEEARLHDGVDTAAHAGRFGHFVAVDHEELQLLLDDVFLHVARQLGPHFVGTVHAVQQEHAAGRRVLQDVILFEEHPLVAADEVGRGDQIRRVNGPRTKAQMRGGQRAGLLGVIDEVALRVIGRLFADDLDRVLVRADRAVGTEAVEHRAHHIGRFGAERPDRHSRLVKVTSSMMPTVKWFFGLPAWPVRRTPPSPSRA